MKFYAATNSYGSDTSIGFANTWAVLVFNSRENRDNFVLNGDMSTMAIKRSEVIGYATNYSLLSNELIKPEPFSTEYWGIVDRYEYLNQSSPAGYIGNVQVVRPEEFPKSDLPARFY